jgi:hypothetical protein
MNNLARGYSDLGQRQEALELEEKVLEAMKETLGEEHPNTLRRITTPPIFTSPPHASGYSICVAFPLAAPPRLHLAIHGSNILRQRNSSTCQVLNVGDQTVSW